ncbi:S1C family serine protease [Halopiger xanaduensis]|uniref:Peptidase S1 and S6 chymotrypsin/Hap n=1 Tax=Halopiger xanaduensis (strain DSM 18323 / JCM 14033 / SH-6) TaxID=797210 RepID=F8D4H6_HALXS|nr:trypsin-like peptidase domain-containing protein [Halopiger xanaduensis]AEH38723.1 peptidase S1 and S6 chymotrypsin/Hap [Halopiger xanaduensis SH-6]
MTPDHVSRRRLLRAAGAASILGVGTASTAAQNETDDSSDGAEPSDDQGSSAPESQYTEVYRNTIDSVVLVTVSLGPTDGRGGGGGLGSGFVVDDQYIVTNNHVVQGATEGGIEIQFNNQEWATASIVGTDPYSDIAVLSVENMPDSAEPLSLVESEPAIGQEVLAIGNPLGLDASVSQGIVSGTNRVLPSPVGNSIPATIQTDAPINPGNSGGPLVNLEGEVVGVVFAGASQTIGFAISARLANRVVPALVEDGTYEHSYMGVGVVPVGPEIAETVGLEEATGVLVAQVVPNSPADGALQPASAGQPGSGDVIVAIDGQEVTTQAQLLSYLALETSPGDTIELEVVRDGERETVELELAARQEFDRQQPPIGGQPGGEPGEQPPFPQS